MSSDKHLELAREKLNPNRWKESGLPGRETQLETIYNFLYNRLKIRTTAPSKRAKIESGEVAKITGRHGNKTIFICGVPGTGKTASVMHVIDKLESELKRKSAFLSKFIPVYINGQHLKSPASIYCELYEKLFDETSPSLERAQEHLDKIFRPNFYDKLSKSKDSKDLIDSYKLVVVDELDLLYSSRREDVFYNLFDWPTAANSKMILIAIANAMDLPERLQGKVSSRLGWEKLVFEPYKSEHLEEILRTRLGQELLAQCFDKASIAIATRRVGRTTGDARRVLDICRHALTCAIQRKLKQVTASVVNEVGFEKVDLQKLDFISNCGSYHLLVLKSILQADEEELRVHVVHILLRHLLQGHIQFRHQNIGPSHLNQILFDLAAEGLIYLEKDKPPLLRRLYLKDNSDVLRDLIKERKVNNFTTLQ